MNREALRVFISFAEEDRDAASELIRELARQGFETYDYSQTPQSTVAGRIADNSLAALHEASLVIVLISSHSTSPDKEFTHLEVDAAIQAGYLERDRLLAVLISGRPPQLWVRLPLRDEPPSRRMADCPKARALLTAAPCHGGCRFVRLDLWDQLEARERDAIRGLLPDLTSRTWFGPYHHLKPHLWPSIDRIGEGEFRDFAKLVCERLGRPYRPPVHSDSRLPIYERLRKEIIERPEWERQQLWGDCHQFEMSRVSGDWFAAHGHIERLLARCSLTNKPYYGLILKGVTLLYLAVYDAAEMAFSQASQFPQADENAFAGLAKSHFLRGQFDQAVKHSEQALALCQDGDTIAQMDLLQISLAVCEREDELASQQQLVARCRNYVLDDARFESIDSASQAIEDRIRIRHLLAARLLVLGRTGQADTILTQTLDEPAGIVPIEPSSLTDFPELSQPLRESIARSALYFDKESRIVSSDPERGLPARHDFTIKEHDRLYRFRQAAPVDAGGPEGPDKQDWNYHLSYIDAALATRRFDLQLQLGRLADAVRRLQKLAVIMDHCDVWHRLALGHCATGNIRKASQVYADKLCIPPHRRPHFLLEACRLQRQLGNASAALAIAREAALLCEEDSIRHPEDSRYYFYYMGFAHFLLGHSAEAQVYYHRSNRFDRWYEQVVP